MRFEIINPHDPFFMEADSFAAALGAVLILGEGGYGLIGIDGVSPDVPPQFVGDWGRSIYEAAGIDPPEVMGLLAWMQYQANNAAVAAALGSITYSGEPTSLVDLAARGAELAKCMLGRQTFESVEGKYK